MKISLVLDMDGAIERLSLSGHVMESPRGENLACAAVSLAARSLARLLANRPGWVVDGEASKPGNLSLAINRRPEDTTQWLKGVSDSFIRAIADIHEEYPSALSVHIEEK